MSDGPDDKKGSEDPEVVNGDGKTGTGSVPESKGSAEGDKKGSEGLTVSLEEHEALKIRMQEADRRRTEAEALIEEQERSKRSEFENTQKDLEKITAERDQLANDLRITRVENAFLAHNTHSWHSPERALKLIDLSEVTIDESGKVIGLDKAINALAKSDPYLLKEKDSPTGHVTQGGQRTGDVNDGKTGEKPSDEALMRKYKLRR